MSSQEFLAFLRIVYRWLWVIIVITATTIGTMIFVAVRAVPMYRSAVTLQITAPPPQEAPLFSQYDREAASQQILQTRDSVAEFLQEGDVASLVLERHPEINMSEEELVNAISVELRENSQLMDVYVKAPSPETAALLANSVAEVSRNYYAQLLAQPTTHALNFIEEQLAIAEASLLEAESSLEQFQLEHVVFDLRAAISDQSRLITTLRENADTALAAGEQARYLQLQALIAARQDELQSLIRLVPEYSTLSNRVEYARSWNDFLNEKRNEAQIKESQILFVSAIQILNPARPARRPLPVFGVPIITLAIVSSVLAGVLLAFLLQALESSGFFGSARMHTLRDLRDSYTTRRLARRTSR